MNQIPQCMQMTALSVFSAACWAWKKATAVATPGALSKDRIDGPQTLRMAGNVARQEARELTEYLVKSRHIWSAKKYSRWLHK